MRFHLQQQHVEGLNIVCQEAENLDQIKRILLFYFILLYNYCDRI